MKRIVLSVLIVAFLFTLIPTDSYAWGRKGHQIVAYIAYHYLDSTTRLKVLHYLHKTTFEDAATWMDEMRSYPYYNYQRPWHFIDIDSGQTYVPVPEYNIITVLNSAIIELENKQNLSNKKIKEDLLLLFHLTGDITQPLHVGYPVDKGGNSIDVSFLHKGEHTNLHAVWDDEIIDSKDINVDSCINQYNNFTPEQIIAIQKISVLQWFNDSRSYLPEVYNFQNGFIDQAYVDKNYVLVEQQLLKGGLRLASVLERVFGG
jgi:hypothetical protein